MLRAVRLLPPIEGRISSRAISALLLLMLASTIAFGGGGPHAPRLTLALQVLALLTVGLFACRHLPFVALWSTVPGWLVAGMLALIALQLVPLPPAIYANLAGRGPLLTALLLAGEQRTWRPLSLDPDATRLAAEALLVPLTLLASTLQADRATIHLALRAIAGLAVASALLGLVQIGNTRLLLYQLPPFGLPVGFFANRNHQADLLLCGIVVLILLAPAAIGRSTTLLLALAGVVALLALTILATGSRAGVALLLPTLALAWLARRTPARRGLPLLVVAGPAAAVAAGIAAARLLPQLAARFAEGPEQRLLFWPDVVYAIGLHLPWGSGLGTFDLVFRAAERLDNIAPLYVNHAHSDYLELLLETGVLCVPLLIGFLAWFAHMGRRAWRTSGDDAAAARAATIMIAVLLLHSAVDYPLRTQALAGVFALACGALARLSERCP